MVNIMLDFLYYLMVILGIVFLFVAIAVPKKLMFPNPKKVKIINEQEYIRSQRILFLTIGICYSALGLLCILKILSLNIAVIFISGLPVALMVFNDKINKKYLRKKY